MATDQYTGMGLWDREMKQVLTSQGRGRINCSTRMGRRVSVWDEGQMPSGDQCRLRSRKARALAAEVPVRQMTRELVLTKS